MKHHGQKRQSILLIILRKTLEPFLLGALFLPVSCILSEAQGHPVPDSLASTQADSPGNPLRDEYRTALQALRSGLLDSSASLSRQVLRTAAAGQDSDYMVKAAILLGNIASREQDYAWAGNTTLSPPGSPPRKTTASSLPGTKLCYFK